MMLHDFETIPLLEKEKETIKIHTHISNLGWYFVNTLTKLNYQLESFLFLLIFRLYHLQVDAQCDGFDYTLHLLIHSTLLTYSLFINQ